MAKPAKLRRDEETFAQMMKDYSRLLWTVAGGILSSAPGCTERVFYVGTIENLANYTLRLRGWYYTDVVMDEWAVSFTVPDTMETKSLPAGQAVPLGDGEVTINKLTLSPLGLRLGMEGAAAGTMQPVLVYADGRKVPMLPIEELELGAEYGAIEYDLVSPVKDMEDVVAVELNGVRFEIPGVPDEQ